MQRRARARRGLHQTRREPIRRLLRVPLCVSCRVAARDAQALAMQAAKERAAAEEEELERRSALEGGGGGGGGGGGAALLAAAGPASSLARHAALSLDDVLPPALGRTEP